MIHKKATSVVEENKWSSKTLEKEKVITNLENFYKSRQVFNFFRDYTKLLFDASYETRWN